MAIDREEVFQELLDFEKHCGKNEDITRLPAVLEDYLLNVAQTGDVLYPWRMVRPVIMKKMELVFEEFCVKHPYDNSPTLPNVEPFNFQEMRDEIMERFDVFLGTPFTIQRICEILTDPYRDYRRIDKLMRGIEKNVRVVSTIDPKNLNHVSATKRQDFAYITYSSLVSFKEQNLVSRSSNYINGLNTEDQGSTSSDLSGNTEQSCLPTIESANSSSSSSLSSSTSSTSSSLSSLTSSSSSLSSSSSSSSSSLSITTTVTTMNATTATETITTTTTTTPPLQQLDSFTTVFAPSTPLAVLSDMQSYEGNTLSLSSSSSESPPEVSTSNLVSQQENSPVVVEISATLEAALDATTKALKNTSPLENPEVISDETYSANTADSNIVSNADEFNDTTKEMKDSESVSEETNKTNENSSEIQTECTIKTDPSNEMSESNI